MECLYICRDSVIPAYEVSQSPYEERMINILRPEYEIITPYAYLEIV